MEINISPKKDQGIQVDTQELDQNTQKVSNNDKQNKDQGVQVDTQELERNTSAQNSAYYTKIRQLLTNRIMKDGKKEVAQRIVYSVFDDTKENQEKLLKLINILSPDKYLKKLVIAGTTRKIPTIANSEKKIKLAIQIIKIGLDYTIRKLHSTNVNSRHGEKKKSDNSFSAAVTYKKHQLNYNKKGMNAISALKNMVDEALNNKAGEYKGILLECKQNHINEIIANKAYENFRWIS